MNLAPELKIKYIIADSLYLFAEGIKSVLSNHPQFELIKILYNLEDVKPFVLEGRFDLLIADHLLVEQEFILFLKNLKERKKEISILIIADEITLNEINELSRAGINNIIHKNCDIYEFNSAIESCLKKKKYYSGEILDLMLDNQSAKSKATQIAQLTFTELEIVKAIAGGFTTKEIANLKNVSYHTVMSHRKNIFRKLGIGNAPELLMYAVKMGIIDTIDYQI
jgi:DNA-binding NarL/FixJ family response regulator